MSFYITEPAPSGVNDKKFTTLLGSFPSEKMGYQFRDHGKTGRKSESEIHGLPNKIKCYTGLFLFGYFRFYLDANISMNWLCAESKNQLPTN